jgi:hypothetical protein
MVENEKSRIFRFDFCDRSTENTRSRYQLLRSFSLTHHWKAHKFLYQTVFVWGFGMSLILWFLSFFVLQGQARLWVCPQPLKDFATIQNLLFDLESF